MKLADYGYCITQTSLEPATLASLRAHAFVAGQAGTRCLLDHPVVKNVAIQLRAELSSKGLLSESAIAIQAIAFDKNPDANWKVAWHQDVMFPFAARTRTAGFDLPCVKEGVDYARPPVDVA